MQMSECLNLYIDRDFWCKRFLFFSMSCKIKKNFSLSHFFFHFSTINQNYIFLLFLFSYYFISIFIIIINKTKNINTFSLSVYLYLYSNRERKRMILGKEEIKQIKLGHFSFLGGEFMFFNHDNLQFLMGSEI